MLGGYALANLGAIALYRLLPGSHERGVAIALLVSFPVYAAAVIWAFGARTAAGAWLGLLAPSAAFALLIGLARQALQP